MNLPPARLLLIDDDELLLTTLVSVMKRQGYSVSAARDGSEGFRLAADIHPDLIICDVRMPSPDGYELKTLLSGSPDTRDIPFIFLTAFGAPEDKVRGLMHGADDYITKPFDLNELIARVQNLLRRMEFGRQRGIKESEEKIRELRQSITANFHHEVRTPLSNLLATLDLALREKFTGNPHAVHRYIESAQNSAQRLRRLIDDLMLLNDIDHNTVSGFRQEIHLRYHFLNVIHNTIQGWSEKNLQAEIHFDETQRIFAPKNEFSLAVMHLVDNAAKFSPPNGIIRVTLEPNPPGGCILTISDQGPGIPPEYREQVFERYFQISQGDNRVYPGLGIGLTLARAVARALQGDVEICTSDSGCHVRLVLPPARLDWLPAS